MDFFCILMEYFLIYTFMKKKEDFKDQKMIVLPEISIQMLKTNSFTKNLYPTDIGVFPHALNHYRERKQGISENILFICTEGSGWIECFGEKYRLLKNDYFIIPKDTPHRYFADPANPWSIFWIHFTGLEADHFIAPFNYPRQIPESNTARFEDRLQLFNEMLISLEDYSEPNLEYSCVLLTHLLGSLKYLSQFRKLKEVQQKDPVSKAKLYMNENLRSKFTLNDIATYCELSLSHFCLVFKKETSYTPVEYLTMLRIKKACMLLSFTSNKIKHIANEVGYEDPYYFSRTFAKAMGQSPIAYRKHKQDYIA